MDFLKPNLELKVNMRQWQQKLHHDKHCRERKFAVGGRVLVRNHNKGDRWLPGQITRRTGPVSFEVELDDGRSFRCHQDHLRNSDLSRGCSEPSFTATLDDDWFPSPQSVSVQEESALDPPDPAPPPQGNRTATPQVTSRRYPSRDRRPPQRY